MERPLFHFTPQSGWINDPHGITFRNNGYDVFFQYVPERTEWTPNCQWGHARGSDLLSLRELPAAIATGQGDDGVWSGSVVVPKSGEPCAFYTSTRQSNYNIGSIRTARCRDDDWLRWAKGPVVVEAPSELDLRAFRDPFVTTDGDGWRMYVGAGSAGGTAMVLTYHSPDLDKWTYDGVALARSRDEATPVWMGSLWECPQIFDVADQSVMVSSVWDDDVLHYAGYAVGTCASGRFASNHWGRLTYGSGYYAPSFFRDRLDRPCLSLWLRGPGGRDVGWAGAHSLPYLLGFEGGELTAVPHPDLDGHLGDVSDEMCLPTQHGDITWDAPPRGELVISSGVGVLARAAVEGGVLNIHVGARSTKLPRRGAVRFVLDGPILEVSTAVGLFGATVTSASQAVCASASDGDLRLRPFRHH